MNPGRRRKLPFFETFFIDLVTALWDRKVN